MRRIFAFPTSAPLSPTSHRPSRPALLGTALTLALLLAGCSSHDNRPRSTTNIQAGGLGILYSPNGEPLTGGPLGKSPCQDAVGHWFDRVNSNHHSELTLEDYLADAARQFDVMDLNHDGIITPAELSTYRLPYEPSVKVQKHRVPGSTGHDEDDEEGGGRSSSRPAGPVDISDPVMSADVGLRFRVSREDFLSYAHTVFARLNTAHNGHLSREEITKATCGPTPEK